MYLFDTLDGHGVVVLKEHDAHLPQPPTGKFFVLRSDVSEGHRGDGADEGLVVLPHCPTGGDLATNWPEADLASRWRLRGSLFPLRLRRTLGGGHGSVSVHARNTAPKPLMLAC